MYIVHLFSTGLLVPVELQRTCDCVDRRILPALSPHAQRSSAVTVTIRTNAVAEIVTTALLSYIVASSLCERTADTAETVDQHRPLHMPNVDFPSRWLPREALQNPCLYDMDQLNGRQ